MTSIGSYAFLGCANMTEIMIPAGVTSAGQGIFASCGSLTAVTGCTGSFAEQLAADNDYTFTSVPYTGTRGTLTWTLDPFTGVLTITGSGSISNFGTNTNSAWLAYRKYIRTVNIGSGVTRIGNSAFLDCGNLTSVTIPDSVTEIGAAAFNGCAALASVDLPGELTAIGVNGFRGCSSLTAVTVPGKVTQIEDRVFWGCTGLTSVTLPGSLTYLGPYVFRECTGLASVTVSEGMTALPDSVFSGCTSLTSVILPDSLETIGNTAFFGCTALTSFTVPSGVKQIGENAFSGDLNLTVIVIPDSVESIGNGAVPRLRTLTAYVGDGSYAMQYMQENEIQYIIAHGEWGTQTWRFDPADGKLTISGTGAMNQLHPYSADAWLRYSNDIRSAVIGEGVTSIGNCAFYDCVNLESILIPAGVTGIGSLAFENCTGLESITLPDSVTSIGRYAFEYCRKLPSIRIPDGVTVIGDWAFAYCDKLTEIVIPAGVTVIEPYIIAYSDKLTRVVIQGNISDIYNRAFDYHGSGLTIYGMAGGLTEQHAQKKNIPFVPLSGTWGDLNWVLNWSSGTLTLGGTGTVNDFPASSSSAWQGLKDHIRTVVIGNGVTGIGERAFSECAGLESITVPAGVLNISTGSVPAGALIRCYQFSAAYFYAAENGNERDILPGSVTRVTPAMAGSNGTIYVKGEDAPRAVSGGAVLSLPAGVTRIGEEAFSGVSAQQITIPSGCISIGSKAFADCDGLKLVIIPPSVTSIAADAFSGCGDAVIFCSKDSCAAQYAAEHGMLIFIP